MDEESRTKNLEETSSLYPEDFPRFWSSRNEVFSNQIRKK